MHECNGHEEGIDLTADMFLRDVQFNSVDYSGSRSPNSASALASDYYLFLARFTMCIVSFMSHA